PQPPQLDHHYYNFQAFNFPKPHPPPHIHHSFYITHQILIPTHTSPVHPRTIHDHQAKSPLKIISPRKLYPPHNHHPTHSH
ncbi:tRNA ligase subunit PheS family protein, partial [Siminovitchia fortis]